MGFGAYLGRLLKDKDISLNQLSMSTRIDSGHLSRIIRETRGTPKPDTIKVIAEALGVPYQELLEQAGYVDKKSKEMTQKAQSIAEAVSDPDSEEAKALYLRAKNAGLSPDEIRFVFGYAIDMAKKNHP